ncbi:MAG: hypothetical protein LBV41_08270 [Cytophagaceae bacterium]|nr:hypothetical protein [Cytophagaceae bacterium]
MKVSVNPSLAANFKQACIRKGASMAGELSAFMAQKTNQLTLETKQMQRRESLATRGLRRRAVEVIITRLEDICAAEEDYMHRIPENLHGSNACIAAEQAVDVLNSAIDLLNEAF